MANGLFSLFPHLVEASVAQAKNVLEQDPYAKQNSFVVVTVLFISFFFVVYNTSRPRSLAFRSYAAFYALQGDDIIN